MALFSMPEWTENALCRGSGLDFTPDLEAGKRLTEAQRENVESCKRLCRRCPVVEECRSFADRVKPLGVWGGKLRNTLPPERRTRVQKTHLGILL